MRDPTNNRRVARRAARRPASANTRSASRESEQRLHVIGGDTGVAAHEGFVFGELGPDCRGQAEAFAQKLIGELAQSVLDRGIEIADGFEHRERHDAVNCHGARNVPPVQLIRK
jgi:hypothetical protein